MPVASSPSQWRKHLQGMAHKVPWNWRLRGRYLVFLVSLATLSSAYWWGLPSAFAVNVGEAGHQPYLENFDDREQALSAFRWTKGYSTIRIPELGCLPATIRLTAAGGRPEGEIPAIVTVWANSRMIGNLVVQKDVAEYEFAYHPVSFCLWPSDLLVEIRSDTFHPLGEESRSLGILVSSLEATPTVGRLLSHASLPVSLAISLAGAFSLSLCHVSLRRVGVSRRLSFACCMVALLVTSLSTALRIVPLGYCSLFLAVVGIFALSSVELIGGVGDEEFPVAVSEGLGHRLMTRDYIGPIRQTAALMVFLLTLTVGLRESWRWLGAELSFIRDNPSLTYDDKMRNKWGDYYHYMIFVRTNTPESATVVIPSQTESWEKTGNSGLDSYFLYPRHLVHMNKIAEAEYVMVVRAEDGGDEVFPSKPWPSGRMMWMKSGWGMIELRAEP